MKRIEERRQSINENYSSCTKIPETVVGAVDAMSPLLEGIEAVTAASKLLEEAKKEDEKDAHKVAVLKSTTILYKCTSKFLSQYSLKQEDINKIVEEVEKQLSGLPSTIPASWKLLTVKNLLDLIKNVEKYFVKIGEGIQVKFEGGAGKEIGSAWR